MILADPKSFWSGRTAAVTGATGFIGHHLAMQLRQRGAEVAALVRPTSACHRLLQAGIRCIQAPLEDAEALAQACRGCEFLFHLAGAVDFESDWARFRRINVEGSQHVVAAARSAGVRRLIHTSSIVAVGATPRPLVLDETVPWNLGGVRVPYVTTKRRAEECVLSAADRALEVVVVNPASVVGPDDFSNSEFGTVCRRFWRGRIPFHFGGGNNFVDVRDVATGHLLAAERGRTGERYILGGSNHSYTAFFTHLARAAKRSIFRLRMPQAFGTLVAQINERLGRRHASRSYLTPGQVRLLSLFFYYDSSKARRELSYQPRSLHESLADTYQFWASNSNMRDAGHSVPGPLSSRKVAA